MRRTNAIRRRWVTVGAGALLAAVGVVLVVTGLGQKGSAPDCEGGGCRRASVAVECEGWTGGNVPLGVFVEGTGAGAAFDGDAKTQQLLFEGSGSQTVGFAGECAAVAQLPQIMLQDGRVLCAGDPARARCSNDEETQVRIVYEAVDLRGMTDDDLAGVASVSFLDESASARALESAKQLRDRAADKEEDHA